MRGFFIFYQQEGVHWYQNPDPAGFMLIILDKKSA